MEDAYPGSMHISPGWGLNIFDWANCVKGQGIICLR